MDMPILYFPLKVVIIDDDDLVINTLQLNLSKKSNIATYKSAKEFLQEIENNHDTFEIDTFLNSVLNSIDNDELELQLNVSLSNLTKLIEIKEKLNYTAIVVSDYHMPEMNGLELFHKLSNKFKRILLTGHQDLQTIINAFDEKIIDKFLPKSDENLISKLEKNIYLLTLDFFNQHTKHIRSNIETANKTKLPFSDNAFNNFLCTLIKDNKIEEYCLIDSNGSLLLVDTNNERYFLVVHTNESLDKFASMYTDNDFNIFINNVKKRNLIPFFANTDPAMVEPTDWINFMYKPEILCGDNVYYLNFFKEGL